MLLQQANAESPSLDEELRDAWRQLSPRMVLFEGLVKFKDKPQEREITNDDICEARRDFLDSFAYLCDIEKGGATVTAAALQKLQHSNILWLAANEGIRPQVLKYGETLLSILRKIDSMTEEEVRDDILQLALENCASRINFYIKELQKSARNCRMQLRRESPSDNVRALRSRLKKLSEPPPSMAHRDIVELCYSMRGAEVKAIRDRSKDTKDDFDRLAHSIGRLGATRSAAITVVRSVIRVPSLRRISQIRKCIPPKARPVELNPAPSPYEIVWQACEGSAFQNPIHVRSALHAIVNLDLPPNPKVRAHLAQRKTIITRVHAELQIADKFSRDSKFMEFVDSDRYIGCSKPACYFCFNWLGLYKHKYIPPATHQKILPGCRGPDIQINDARATILKEMYAQMCGILDQDIITALLKDENRGPSHASYYLSTEGSSRAPSQI